MGRNKYLLITGIFMAVLSGCGKKQQLDLGQFAPYVQHFEQHAAEHGQNVQVTDLIVHFGRMENELERGICEINGDTTPTITINEEAWNKMDENEREPLMFHELGHCVLHRKHEADQLSAGVPKSLMNPYTIPDFTYAAYHDYYLNELYAHKDDF